MKLRVQWYCYAAKSLVKWCLYLVRNLFNLDQINPNVGGYFRGLF